MLSILDRYFLRELAQAVLAVAVVLMVIVAGGTFTRVIQQVANGSFPASVMFPVLGLRLIDGLSALLPLACFLGVLQALGRMYRESEMHVLSSSGMGAAGVLRPAAIMAAVLVAIVGAVALWLGPWASRSSDAMVDAANRSVVAAGLSAGHFTELPGKGGIIFTDALSRDGSTLGKTFIAVERVGSDGVHRIKLVTGASGHLYQESDGSGRYLALYNGWQYELPLNTDNWRRMRYAGNDASIASVTDDDDSDDATHNLTTFALLSASNADARAELAWRIASPVTALVLMVLALPLSRQSPREPRFGRLLLAVLGYFLYSTLLALCRNQIAKGHWHHSTGMWALHGIVLVLAVWMLYRQYAPRRGAMPARVQQA